MTELADEVGGMSRVVLGGFSQVRHAQSGEESCASCPMQLLHQGGALSLYTGLQMDPNDPLGEWPVGERRVSEGECVRVSKRASG